MLKERIEGISKSKDEMIRSITKETRVYRELLLVLTIFMLLLLFLIVFPSVR